MFKINITTETSQRYDPLKFINYSEGTFDILDSEFLRQLQKIKQYGVFKVTTEQFRPELISEKIYGAGLTQYWWILMIFNELRSPNELVNGLELKYPFIESLENIYFTLVPTTGIRKAQSTREKIL